MEFRDPDQVGGGDIFTGGFAVISYLLPLILYSSHWKCNGNSPLLFTFF